MEVSGAVGEVAGRGILGGGSDCRGLVNSMGLGLGFHAEDGRDVHVAETREESSVYVTISCCVLANAP